jgi:hypothetical protein
VISSDDYVDIDFVTGYVNSATKEFAEALKDYASSVKIDYDLLDNGDKTSPINAGDICQAEQANINSISEQEVHNFDETKSNVLGYLAILTALAEFADGNRESAIRLLHNRIERETDNLKTLQSTLGGAAETNNDLYLIARKQVLIRRLIRIDYNLIELVQDPVRSPALDQIAFDLTIQGINLDPILLMANQVKQSFDRAGVISDQFRSGSDFLSASVGTLAKSSPAFAAAILAGSPKNEAISDDIVIAALEPIPGGRCSDKMMSIGSSEEDKNKRTAFYLAVIDHLQFINNALNYVGKNGEIVLSVSWSGDQIDLPTERNSTQPTLIRKLDSFADRLLRILKSQDEDPLGCLARENTVTGLVHSSDLLASIGSYFEIKGKNFGAAAAPRVADYDEPDSGPVQRTEDRIKALCYALIMYEDALERLAKLDRPSKDAHRFGKSLTYYDQFEHKQTLSRKPAALKDLLNQTYTQGQIHQYCPSAYP